jgi:hypothetical protein
VSFAALPGKVRNCEEQALNLRRLWRLAKTAAALAAMMAAGSSSSWAQAVASGVRAVSLDATLPESVTLSLSSNAVNFNLTPGRASNPGSNSITATTTWTLQPAFLRRISVYSFFSNANAALTDGAGNNIPSSAFQISDNGGGYRGLTNATPFGGAGAGLLLGQSTEFLFLFNTRGTRTDTMNFNIDLSQGTLPNLPAATYSGTLTIQVQVQ